MLATSQLMGALASSPSSRSNSRHEYISQLKGIYAYGVIICPESGEKAVEPDYYHWWKTKAK